MEQPTLKPSLSGTWSQTTLVTSLINIGREAVDGRKFDDYIKWFTNQQKRGREICFIAHLL